jgi:hypothetical protein
VAKRTGTLVALLLGCACGRLGYPGGATDGGTADGDTAPCPGCDACGPACIPHDATGCDDRHSGALFCSGFEDGTLGQHVYTSDGELVLAPRAYRGQASLRARTLQAPGDHAVAHWDLPAITGGTLYLRTYLYATAVQTGDWLVLAQLGGMPAGSAPQKVSMDIYSDDRLVVTSTLGNYLLGGDTRLPLDRWLCAELAIEVGDAGRMEVRLDGVPASYSTTPVDTLPAGGFTGFFVGYWGGDENMAADVYHDELVVDDAPIGCD